MSIWERRVKIMAVSSVLERHVICICFATSQSNDKTGQWSRGTRSERGGGGEWFIWGPGTRREMFVSLSSMLVWQQVMTSEWTWYVWACLTPSCYRVSDKICVCSVCHYFRTRFSETPWGWVLCEISIVCSASQEIPLLLRNTKVYYRVELPVSILSQMSPVCIPTPPFSRDIF